MVELPQADIPTLLDEFCKLPNCAKYKTALPRIELIKDYLWLRQLGETLTFESFLQRFSKVAHHDEDNKLHPTEAIKQLPRSKKEVAELGGYQWSASEVCDFMCYYVDLVRESERVQTDVPITLAQWLGNKELQAKYLSGEFGPKKELRNAPRRTPKSRKVSAPKPVQLEERQGVRAIYALPGGLQYRGHAIDSGRDRVDFQTDDGELVLGVPRELLIACNDPPAIRLVDSTGKAVTSTVSGSIVLTNAEYQRIAQLLSYTGAYPQVDEGVELNDPMVAEFAEGGLVAELVVYNSETGPYVQASLCEAMTYRTGSPESVLHELQPRELSILGKYYFISDGVAYVLDVELEDFGQTG